MTRHINKIAAVLVLSLASAAFAGCSGKNGELVLIEKDMYERASRRSAEVKKGDLYPVVKLTLQVEGYERVVYNVSTLDLTLDKVHVSLGDKVKTGDLLVSFKSDNIDNTIAGYEQQRSDNELLIEHLKKLMEIDSAADYSSDIRMLEEDIMVAELYIEEAGAKLESYQIVARGDGTIVSIDDYLTSGFLVDGRNLVTQICGTGNYTAKTTSDFEFGIGDVYTAVSGIFSYDLRLTGIELQENVSGKAERLLTFEPVSDMSAVSDAESLSMVVEKPVLENVVYVEASAIHEADGRYFVYVFDEEGFRSVAWVEIGDAVDTYRVITDGLVGGEKVSLD
ncbi:MAG: efflux RND transporter periplasmic adaptor subunit [Butyrivibrio sp.]|nr:efflux RND transporter periplasmic adaptor subunit [Butyrivibrio sp.]